MHRNEPQTPNALARAAARWQKATVVLTDAPLPQLADLAARRTTEGRPLHAVPSPFRPRRA